MSYTLEDAALAVYRTFGDDLTAGIRTRDKVFAVTLLGKALGLQTEIRNGDEDYGTWRRTKVRAGNAGAAERPLETGG